MKNPTITQIPLKFILIIFFAGFIGATIFGILFSIAGLIFAKYLGYPVVFGAEEIIMGESAIFYGILAIPIGALVGSRLAIKFFKYKSKFIYSFLIAFAAIIAGLLLKNTFSVYTFLLFAVICSIFTTGITIYDIAKSHC